MKLARPLTLMLFLASSALAQDTLKVMNWNVLNYTLTNRTRDKYYRTVIRHVNPDVLVTQEMTSQAAVDTFFAAVVNLALPGQFSKGVFNLGPDTGNEIFYRTSKFTFLANTPIHTALRDISEFKLYNATAADTFRVYSVHLKASMGFEGDRAAEVDSLRKVTNKFPNGKYFIVTGDYNIYTANEPAYDKLLHDNPTDDGNFVDALTMPGTWNNNPAYAPYHTQSTRTRAIGDGGATGGLDDRFDMILFSHAMSQPGRIRYLLNSLTPVGNDGNHLNDSINKQPNTAVPDSVANALYFASDHLPVFARFIFSPGTPSPHAITASTGPNGSIAPSGVVTVADSGAQMFTITPGTGYHIDSVVVDGLNTGGSGTYTFTNVTNDHTIRSVFAIDQFTISASADSHGTIAPSGLLSVGYGGAQQFAVTPASGYAIDSLVVDGARSDSTVSYTFTGVAQDHTITATFRALAVMELGVSQGWNMVSVPLSVVDGRKTALFPSAVTDAYTFDPASGYVIRDTLRNGVGYWLKFPGIENVNITGEVLPRDTVAVAAGWNLVGSISSFAIPDSIIQSPPGIVGSSYYGYDGTYSAADTLRPGKAYWVKVNQNGELILR